MSDPVTELRLAWILLLVSGGAAILPPSDGVAVPLAWAVAAVAGSLVAFRRPQAENAARALAALGSERRARIQVLVLLALLAFTGAVFSLSASLFVATLLGAAVLWAAAVKDGRGAGRILDHSTALGGALTLVLLPVEAALHLPPISRHFGLPAERVRREQSYDRLWEHNLFHLRSRYERIARTPGVPRVLALGDSFTWGLYITDSDSTWPAQLERRLGGPAEVINMGQRGWTTYNEAEFLSRLGWQFDPDLVIVQFYLNDAYESGAGFGHEEGHRIYLLPAQFWQGYIQSSALSSLVSKAVNGVILGLLFRESDNTRRYGPESSGWGQLRDALRQMGDSARARGRPALLVLYPDLLPGDWTAESYPAGPIHEQVAEEAKRNGFQVLDLAPAFAAQGGDWARWWATPYDAHPSAAAHAVAAEAIAAYIREHGLLNGARP